MGRIRAKDTQPELIVRRLLHSMGYRYRLHDACLPGKPDLVFPSRRKVVFVHGCFWHGHGCVLGSRPKSNQTYWFDKIAGNQARDRQHLRSLRSHGWQVHVVRECGVRWKLGTVVPRLLAFLER